MEDRKGFKKGQKKRMMLSQETLDGLHITSKLYQILFYSNFILTSILKKSTIIPGAPSYDIQNTRCHHLF